MVEFPMMLSAYFIKNVSKNEKYLIFPKVD